MLGYINKKSFGSIIFFPSLLQSHFLCLQKKKIMSNWIPSSLCDAWISLDCGNIWTRKPSEDTQHMLDATAGSEPSHTKVVYQRGTSRIQTPPTEAVAKAIIATPYDRVIGSGDTDDNKLLGEMFGVAINNRLPIFYQKYRKPPREIQVEQLFSQKVISADWSVLGVREADGTEIIPEAIFMAPEMIAAYFYTILEGKIDKLGGTGKFVRIRVINVKVKQVFKKLEDNKSCATTKIDPVAKYGADKCKRCDARVIEFSYELYCPKEIK